MAFKSMAGANCKVWGEDERHAASSVLTANAGERFVSSLAENQILGRGIPVSGCSLFLGGSRSRGTVALSLPFSVSRFDKSINQILCCSRRISANVSGWKTRHGPVADKLGANHDCSRKVKHAATCFCTSSYISASQPAVPRSGTPVPDPRVNPERGQSQSGVWRSARKAGNPETPGRPWSPIGPCAAIMEKVGWFPA
jgi:hypothetical protein